MSLPIVFRAAAHADSDELGGRDQEGSLGPLALNRLGRNTGRGRDFRQRCARVTVGGEEFRCGFDHP